MDIRHLAIPALATLTAVGGQAHASSAMRIESGHQFLKATPSMEGGQRILYLEASKELRDLQGERILVKALEESIPYFLKFGKIDLDHASVTGQIRGQKVNPYAFEIGRPLDVRVDRNGDTPSIFVKIAVFQSKDGTGNRFTEAADLFWDSLNTNPPTLWYPSVQGYVLDDGPAVDDGKKTVEVRKLQWHSIGLSRTPVNHHVGPASLVPLPIFAKAFGSQEGVEAALRSMGMSHALGLQESFDPSTLPGGEMPDLDPMAMEKILHAIAESSGEEVGPNILQLIARKEVNHEQALACLLAIIDTTGAPNA
jgi:hypothetical protein